MDAGDPRERQQTGKHQSIVGRGFISRHIVGFISFFSAGGKPPPYGEIALEAGNPLGEMRNEECKIRTRKLPYLVGDDVLGVPFG